MTSVFNTVGDLVNRVYNEWLQPSEEQPTRLTLNADITSSATSLTYTDEMISTEEEELIGPGTVVEINGELILIRAISPTTNTMSSLVRGAQGTIKKSHKAGSIIFVAPNWPRKVILDAVSDSIDDLWPRLYYTDTLENVSVIKGKYAEVPSETERVLKVFNSKGIELGYQFRSSFPLSSTGKAIILWDVGPVDIDYVLRPIRPDYEHQSLDEINVKSSWSGVIALGAVLNVISVRDIESLSTAFLTERLESELVRPNTAQDLRQALTQHYEYRIQKAVNGLDVSEYQSHEIEQIYAF